MSFLKKSTREKLGVCLWDFSPNVDILMAKMLEKLRHFPGHLVISSGNPTVPHVYMLNAAV